MTTDKILLVKGKAGLGNRLLVVLDSLLFAEMTGRRLIVDWRDETYTRNGENAFPVFFEIPLAGDPSSCEGQSSVVPAAWRGRLHLSVDGILLQDYPDNKDIDGDRRAMVRYTADTRRSDDDATVLVRWAWTDELANLRPRFGAAQRHFVKQSDRFILRTLLRERVRPSAAVRQRVEDFAATHFTDRMIGLHVRYSDRKNAFEGYRMFVDRFLAEYPDGKVFLATDNSDVEAYFRKLYPRVCVTAKWYPAPGEPIHRTLRGNDQQRKGIEAMTDLYLLGRCERLVVNTTSSFGYVATLLSEPTADNVIDTAPFSMGRNLKRVYMWLHGRHLLWDL